VQAKLMFFVAQMPENPVKSALFEDDKGL